MKTRQYLFSLVLLLALLLAACSPQAEPTDTMADGDMESETTSETMDEKDDGMVADDDSDSMPDLEGENMDEKNDDAMMDDKDAEMDDPTEDDMMDEKEDDSMSEQVTEDTMMAPEWFSASLTDVNTGETFSVADFKGKVVLVETLAIWCSNCAKQQGQVQALHDLMGERGDFVSLGIDIDPNESAAALQSYTTNSGFDWVYTVAPTEVSREIGQLYGDQFLNPPSTPMLIIDREGEVHLLPFGIKSAENLLEALQPFLDAEM